MLQSSSNKPTNVLEERAPTFIAPPNFEVMLLNTPIKTKCLYCSENIETTVEYQIGSQSIIMCGFTMPCCLCWVPFVLNRFKDSKHSCPKCNQHLGMVAKF